MYWYAKHQFSFFRCADITNLPLGCTQVKKAGECCPTIQCSNGQTGTFQGSQTQPGTIGGYPVPQAKPTPAPTPGPGLTYAPGLRPTLGPNPTGNSLRKTALVHYICTPQCACRVILFSRSSIHYSVRPSVRRDILFYYIVFNSPWWAVIKPSNYSNINMKNINAKTY